MKQENGKDDELLFRCLELEFSCWIYKWGYPKGFGNAGLKFKQETYGGIDLFIIAIYLVIENLRIKEIYHGAFWLIIDHWRILKVEDEWKREMFGENCLDIGRSESDAV